VHQPCPPRDVCRKRESRAGLRWVLRQNTSACRIRGRYQQSNPGRASSRSFGRTPGSENGPDSGGRIPGDRRCSPGAESFLSDDSECAWLESEGRDAPTTRNRGAVALAIRVSTPRNRGVVMPERCDPRLGPARSAASMVRRSVHRGSGLSVQRQLARRSVPGRVPGRRRCSRTGDAIRTGTNGTGRGNPTLRGLSPPPRDRRSRRDPHG
jgi:hypothetical protein